MKMDLQRFTGHSVTVYKDSGITTATADPNSSVDKDTEVALSITAGSGKEVAEVEVVSGGVTIDYDPDDGYSFDMGEADVVLYVKSKSNKLYKIVENTIINVNGSKTELTRNMMIKYGANGAIVAVDCKGTELSINADILAELVANNIVIKM